MRASLGRFRIGTQLGEGGMGVVYRAHDPELDRSVAIKCLHPAADETARRRLEREARTAARVNHPNICQVFEVGRDGDELYLVMELLEGVPLSDRLLVGPMPPKEAIEVCLEVLAALAVLHAEGIVHRDLKPSNVFLTPNGVKVLDFGVALPLESLTDEGGERLTVTGALVGTPGFMAPEQWTSEELGPPTDIFALGAMLFEMVAGRPAFEGRNLMEVFHAVVHEQPPALAGGDAVLALDRVVQKALGKRPEDRYPSASAMADALRDVTDVLAGAQVEGVRTMTRLMVLPFRMLRPDPSIDFLGEGLAASIGSSLSGLGALVVRSQAQARRFGGDTPDFVRIAQEAEVDAVLAGSLVRAGERLRASVELVETPSGTVLWADRLEVQVDEPFRLEDALATQIVERLAVPLTARDRSAMDRRRPASAEAYELYLRANQMSFNSSQLPQAAELYRACLEAAPDFAPAWARLGRVYRIQAKYGRGDAKRAIADAHAAFERALTLDPDLAAAHHAFAAFEIENLARPADALRRLLHQARRHPADPELFVALVTACRFCGLLQPSAQAHDRAQRLDPGVRTSVSYTHWMAGDYARAVQNDDEDLRFTTHHSLPLMGREQECVESCLELESRGLQGLERHFVAATCATLQGRHAAAIDAVRAVWDAAFPDAEGLFFLARIAVHSEAIELGTEILAAVLDKGFCCLRALQSDPWLAPVRAGAAFEDFRAQADALREAGLAAYAESDGPALLGPCEAAPNGA